jgi:hypothetical protein
LFCVVIFERGRHEIFGLLQEDLEDLAAARLFGFWHTQATCSSAPLSHEIHSETTVATCSPNAAAIDASSVLLGILHAAAEHLVKTIAIQKSERGRPEHISCHPLQKIRKTPTT